MNYRTIQIDIPLMKEPTTTRITTPGDVEAFCADLRDFAQESFHVLMLTTKNTVQNRVMVALGTVDSCGVHPRDVFRAAILENATSIILVHNHPSGDSIPSAEDVSITRRLVEGGKILGIGVIDSIIIGKKTQNRAGHTSMREQGLVTFTG